MASHRSHPDRPTAPTVLRVDGPPPHRRPADAWRVLAVAAAVLAPVAQTLWERRRAQGGRAGPTEGPGGPGRWTLEQTEAWVERRRFGRTSMRVRTTRLSGDGAAPGPRRALVRDLGGAGRALWPVLRALTPGWGRAIRSRALHDGGIPPVLDAGVIRRLPPGGTAP